MTRKLSAIMIADIVGYSRLMGADEAATLAQVRTLRGEVIGPGVAGNRGRIVKGLGDGWLVEFASAVDAVTCAMQVQDKLADHPVIKLRIGVHTGDVVHEDGDVFGDGVNVAARLEQFAEAGGVAISDTAHSSLDGTISPSFDEAGEQQLKNIARPVRVWTRRPPGQHHAPAAGRVSAQANPRQDGFPKLALTPLLTSDPRADVQELADAITSDLGLYFGALGWLDHRTTETPPDGSYVLHGQLRARGDRLRLEVRLDAPDRSLLWSHRLNGDLADSFDWQDSAAEEITSNVIGFIFDDAIAELSQIPRQDRTAAQSFLHGVLRRGQMTRDTFAEALADFDLAITRDPALTEAYAEAIFFAIGGRTKGFTSVIDKYAARHAAWMEQARPLAHKSAALDMCMATAQFFLDGQIPPLRAKITDVLRRAPFDVKILMFSGWGYLWSGDAKSALECFTKVTALARFSPYASIISGGLATAQLQLGNYEAVLEVVEQAKLADIHHSTHVYAKSAALALLGRTDEARETFEQAREIYGENRTISSWKAVADYGGSEGGKRFFDGLRKAGMPE